MATYNKRMIQEKVNNGSLIRDGFNASRIKEACYEATTSNYFFEVTEQTTNRIKIDDGKFYILRPNTQVVCVTEEYFDIPLDCIARVILVGHFFAIGIAPVNTYADPGFKGHLGIVLSNTSRNYLKISPKEKIAKIEFSQMSEPCTEGYVGQHGGDVTTWPFRYDMVANAEFLKENGIDPQSPSEIGKVYGGDLKKTIFRARNFSWQLGVASFLTAAIPMLLIWGIQYKWNASSPFLAGLIGVITGLVANWIFYHIIKGRE